MSTRSLRLMAKLLALIWLLCGMSAAFADTMPSLFQSFAGNVNFVGTQRTLRTAPNTTNACSFVSNATTSTGSVATTATLAGLPDGATISAAYLYWAGSSGTPDYSIVFEGSNLTASRQYTSTGSGTSYFSGVVDVTSKVSAKGNGTYTFSGLRIDAATACGTEGVMGGWALLVIYSHPSEEFRVLNLYEGFQYFHNNSITLNLSNFQVPASFTKGRIAHITWEGDPTLSGGGETLTFNTTTMTDATNVAGNQFNSASTIGGTADSASYGIDFDAYELTSPIIQAGQTTASTRYATGQDLVLLSAEIIAIPNTAVADLAVSLARNNDLELGRNVTYTVAVTNNGPNSEAGPITVTATLPSVLTFVSGNGSGWACSAAGQTVTCTYSGGAIENGATTPALTLTATVSSTTNSSITTSVAVAGTRFDNVSGNNAASDTTTMSVPAYVFTDSACVSDVAFKSASQTCKILAWGNPSPTAGTAYSNVYITSLNSAGVPTYLHKTQVRSKTARFAMSCHNPTTHANVQATFSAVAGTLPLCASNGATPTNWSGSVTLNFPGGVPSVGPYSFQYDDVGRVELFFDVATDNATGSSGSFVVKPSGFVLTGIAAPSISDANANANAPIFIAAGAPFSVTVTAVNSKNVATPNYGRETLANGAETVKLTPQLVAPAGGHLPAIVGNFGAFSNGAATGAAFSWSEAGIVKLTPSVGDGDYLGAGDVTGTTSGNVGRFHAAKFMLSDEAIVNRSAICPSVAICASSFSYLGETLNAVFTLTATAVDGTTTLENYNTATSWAKLDPATAVAAGSAGPFKPAAIDVNGTTRTAFPTCAATPAHPCVMPATASGSFVKGVATITLPLTFARAASPVGPYSLVDIGIAPQDSDGAILSNYDLDTGATASASNKAKIDRTALRYGRLQLSNAHGSELLPLPIPVTAQYWDGTSFITNVDDSLTKFARTSVTLQNFKSNLTAGETGIAASPATIGITAGRGTYTLTRPAGDGSYNGSVDMTVTELNSYLPGNLARARFGVFGGPKQVIYMQEVY